MHPKDNMHGNQDEIGENELLVVSFGTSFKISSPAQEYQRNRRQTSGISGLVCRHCIYSTD